MPPEPITSRFPFSAILGMDDAKRALMCIMVNPRIKSVLIRGGPGVAKTTIARSVSEGISGKRMVNIPLNASEEQVFGGLDVEAAVNDGTIKMQKGLLFRADGGLVYIDDANLLDQKILTSVLDAAHTGRVVVERGAVSDTYPCPVAVIATMNPRDSDLSSHMLDRFDLCVNVELWGGPQERGEILRRNMEFSDDPSSFAITYSDGEEEVRRKIERGRSILPMVTISDELLSIVSELCYSMGVDGYRGDIAMVNAAMALAALNGRDEVIKKDVEEAAVLCLSHRRNYAPEPPSPPPPEKQEQGQNERDEEPPQDQDRPPEDRRDDRPPQEEPDNGPEEGNDNGGPDRPDPPDLQEMLFNIGEQFRVIDYLNNREKLPSKTRSRKGRRGIAESDDMTGRYARSRIVESPRDIAFDATIRAAAPYQRSRENNGLAIVIEERDLREKVRERRSGCTLLFLVDASGSLGVRKRMSTVKGAILSMLRESYVKRDRVGMMAFRRGSAELILPPTKSVEYSYRKLEELPTGGKTPLGEAMVSARTFMTSYTRCHPGERCFIVLVTDGRANVPLKEGADANEEVLALADDLIMPSVRWIVVDASAGYPHYDNAAMLAHKLCAEYFRLEDLNADRLASSVKAVIGT
ncbi:AAA family ATPase [Methanomassiliicoccus luminyensis]|uniref:AAA family ATPase n=1 Tax=Methanomassiliicoccus luminyensis TaxID=1080712 RepID=UPI00191F5BA3|nr:AAA family ATPase [Methanomassiliicoccus luminyensis]